MRVPLALGILSGRSLDTRESGRRLFEIINLVEPALLPEKFDVHEPIRRPFSFQDLDSALSYWGNGFLWKRSRPASLGHYLSGPPYPVDDVLYIRASLGAVPTDRFVTLLERLSTEFGATLGYFDCYSDVVLSDMEHYRECVSRYGQGLTTHDLKSGLPGLPWATYFGEKYVKSMGRGKVLTAPAFAVRPLGEGIFVQLTKTPAVTEDEHQELNQLKLRFMEHVGTSAFRPFCYEWLLRLAQ